MNSKAIRKTAILVDGGYYRKRALDLWGKKSPEKRADELFNYCFLHISKPEDPRDLYRIFYYDCPPMTKAVMHPLTEELVNYEKMTGTKWTNDFFSALLKKRKLALRRGELAESQAQFVLKSDVLHKLISGEIEVSKLKEKDFITVL